MITCPICKSGVLESERKVKGFLFKKQITKLRCDTCGAIFEETSEGKYRLVNFDVIEHGYLEVYSKKPRTLDEWGRIVEYNEIFNHIIEALEQGELLNKFQLIVDAPIIPKKNEVIYLGVPGISFMEPRKYTARTYGGGGVRIAKGVYIGGGVSQPHKYEKVEPIDSGVFVITNRRVVFVGSKRTLTIPLSKLLFIEPYKDGVVIGKESRQKPMYFVGFEKFRVTFVFNGAEYSYPLSGRLIVPLVRGLLNTL